MKDKQPYQYIPEPPFNVMLAIAGFKYWTKIIACNCYEHQIHYPN